jgi:hypothetical protein
MLPEGPVCDAGRPCTKGNPKACMHVGDSGTLRIYQSTHAGYSLSGSSWANRPDKAGIHSSISLLGRLRPTNRSSRSWHKKLLEVKVIDSEKKNAD